LMTVLAQVIRTREIKVRRRVRKEDFMGWHLLSEVRHLMLVDCTWLDDETLPMLPKLESLSICFSDDVQAQINERGWRRLGAQIGAGGWRCLGGLRKLKLYGCGGMLNDDALGNLPPNLESLQIEMCHSRITNQGMSQLQMKKLVHFNVSSIHDAMWTLTGDEGWACLRGMCHMEDLTVYWSSITDVGVGYICDHMKKLKKLDIGRCFDITPQGWERLSGSGLAFKTLNFDDTNITDFYLAPFITSKLRELSLEGCGEITGKVFGPTFRNSKLESLKLGGCRDIQTGVTAFLPVTLKVLNLRGCAMITDEALIPLKDLHLEVLDLQECKQITDQGIASLPKSLVVLNLSRITTITNNCVPFLLHMKNLQSLDIRDTPISDMRIVKHFKGKLRFSSWS